MLVECFSLGVFVFECGCVCGCVCLCVSCQIRVEFDEDLTTLQPLKESFFHFVVSIKWDISHFFAEYFYD